MHRLYNDHLVHIGNRWARQQILPFQPGSDYCRACDRVNFIELHPIASQDLDSLFLEPPAGRALQSDTQLIRVHQTATSVASQYSTDHHANHRHYN